VAQWDILADDWYRHRHPGSYRRDYILNTGQTSF